MKSGTLLIQDKTMKTVLPPLCASVLAAAVLTALLSPLLSLLLRLTGPVRGALAALLAYVLFRVLYPWTARLFPGGGMRVVPWEVTADALSIDGRPTDRDTIINIHIWPNRDSLGHPLPGWVVNIERTGKNILLRVPARDDGGGDNLRNMVRALGYGNRWPGEGHGQEPYLNEETGDNEE